MFRITFAGSVLSTVILMTIAPSAYGQIPAIRFQSETVPWECIGGSRKDSKVGLWSCSNETTRYNWEIVETFNSEVFYIRNASKRSRCLGSKSNNYDLRYYSGSRGECRKISLERWRIQDEYGINYTRSDVKSGMTGRTVRLVNEQNGKCMTELGGRLRLRPCNDSQEQLFEVIAIPNPEPSPGGSEPSPGGSGSNPSGSEPSPGGSGPNPPPTPGATWCGLGAPNGYVSVEYRYSSRCPIGGISTTKNATVIQTPRSGQTICGLRAPSGYVSVEYRSSSKCRIDGTSNRKNATIIQTPRSGQTICGLRAPSGYVSVRYTYSSKCRIDGTSTRNNATVIQSARSGSYYRF
ncbi:MAG: hypothetical protein QNJ63_24355 [Calothrix sp. MO_192.B10]|nr:hypothetical protein [Calothrix sp. MO_192.B10]